MPSPRRADDGVPVWNAGIRVLHAALILSLLLSTAGLWWPVGLHQPAGYVAVAAVAVRTLWGLLPATRSSYLRFASFIRAPRSTLAYTRMLLHHREPRYLGHNPLGGWMVVALLACVAALALTGWLYTTDALWGDPRVEQAHRLLAWLLAALAALHVAGVLFTSLRQRENLVRAMLSGRKRSPAGNDIA